MSDWSQPQRKDVAGGFGGGGGGEVFGEREVMQYDTLHCTQESRGFRNDQ